MVEKEVLKPAEFCQRFGIGRTKFYEEINEGRLKAKKVGRHTRVSVDAAREWFAGHSDYQPTAQAA